MRNRIEYCRVQAGMTRKELATESGISEDAIRKWEVGERNIGVASAEKLAHALHVNPSFLVGWSDNPDVYREDSSDYYEFAKPEHQSIKITLDDGREILDSMPFYGVDIADYQPCSLLAFNESAIMAGHIVSIEKVEDK